MYFSTLFDFTKFCQTKDGILAQIKNEQEQVLFEVFLQGADPTSQNYYWVGLTDRSHAIM
jgi:hypothetical protein